jgi:hypothetical protein
MATAGRIRGERDDYSTSGMARSRLPHPKPRCLEQAFGVVGGAGKVDGAQVTCVRRQAASRNHDMGHW